MVKVLVALSLISLAGCATGSRGPSFNPHARAAEIQDDSKFVAVPLTNSIPKEWLVRSRDLFRLGPGDVVEIRALGDDRSSTRALVGPDGKIYFGILPGTFVWGMSLGEAKEALEQQLAKELQSPPKLSVMLRTIGSRRVWLVGQVADPGVYNLATPMTVLEAIASAGGFVTLLGSSEINADLKRSFLIRGNKRVPLDLNRLITRGDLSQNIVLQPDDFLFLAPPQTPDVFVLGAVARPGNVGYSEGVTLIRAVATVGGVAKYGYGSHVAVVRGSLTEPRIAIVDVSAIARGKERDILLEPGDLVYVPFMPFKKVAELADQILNQFVGTIAINEGRNAIIKGAAPVGVSVGVGATPTITR